MPVFPVPQQPFFTTPDSQQTPFTGVSSVGLTSLGDGSGYGLPVYSQVNMNSWYGSDGISRPMSFNFTSPQPNGDGVSN